MTVFWLVLLSWVWYLWGWVLHATFLLLWSFRWLRVRRSRVLTTLLFNRIFFFVNFFAVFIFAVCVRGIRREEIFYRRWSRRCFLVWCWCVRGRGCVDVFLVVFLRSWRRLVDRFTDWWRSILWGSVVCRFVRGRWLRWVVLVKGGTLRCWGIVRNCFVPFESITVYLNIKIVSYHYTD